MCDIKKKEIIYFLGGLTNRKRLNETYFMKHNKKLYDKIANIELNVVFKEKVWFYVNDIKEIPTCEICNSSVNFNKRWVDGYKKFCSSKCASRSNVVRDKAKQTNLERYGVESYNNRDKAKQTNLERYGVENISQSSSVKDKKKETTLKNYGVCYPYMSKEILEKVKCSKNIQTIERYSPIIGEDYSILSKEYDLLKIKHHTNCEDVFEINRQILYDRVNIKTTLCTNCNPLNSLSSGLEEELCYFLDSLNIDYIGSDRSILDGKELDIYIPSLNIAIEFNGLYWHSELYKDKNYHLYKTLKCQEKGIQLLHIFEDDWIFKQDIVKSIIRNKLGLISNRIYARKCIVKEVKSNVAREFLDINHIQGFARSTYKLGLYHDNELVSLMTFGYRKTNSKKEFELIRFCNVLNTNVIGSSSKLFKYFLNNYKIEESYILSYADISLFDGKMYDTLGFKEIYLSKPNYFWVVNKKREHRWKYNKQTLIKEGYDKNKTEVDIMHERGAYRIWGCGQKRYEYIITSKC